ncbi:MAG: hypothetical protein ACPL3P_08125 [Anaerolineales bacterium]
MSSTTKLGLQYFSDNLHYHQAEADFWINEFKALGVNWLVLDNSDLIAIPEAFLNQLMEANITPILVFNFPHHFQKPPYEFQLLLPYYQKVGIRYMTFFKQPNSKNFWADGEWFHGDIVERFIDLFLPYAKLAVSYGIQPIFPPLLVAEDFWDTAFLQLSLQSLLRRDEGNVLDNLLLSAYAHVSDMSRPLDWGAGGPQRFPTTRPFFRPPDSQDQKGLYISDWYQAITQAVLGRSIPIVLFEASQNLNLYQLSELPQLEERHLTIIKSLLPISQSPTQSFDEKELIPFSKNVLCFVFSHLVEQVFSETNYLAWYDLDYQPKSFTEKVKAWYLSRAVENGTINVAGRKLQHVLLVPPLNEIQLNTELAQIQPYLLQNQPQIVFNVEEALLAEHVALLGNLDLFSPQDIARLENSHCDFEIISHNGTKIVTV